MRKNFRRTLTPLLFGLAWQGSFGATLLWGQGNAKQYDELIQSAHRSEMLGYILGAIGLLLVVASIPLSIYLDRKKKSRKKALQREVRDLQNKRDPLAPGSRQRE
jgi:hypothetical protein